jgi:hypothetical protein
MEMRCVFYDVGIDLLTTFYMTVRLEKRGKIYVELTVHFCNNISHRLDKLRTIKMNGKRNVKFNVKHLFQLFIKPPFCESYN